MNTTIIDVLKLREEIYRSGMTQTGIARVTGMSRTTINQICRGLSCSRLTAEKIAAALNVPVEKLMKKVR